LAKTTDFGKNVKIRLIELDKTQDWLIQSVRERTGLYFDSAYCWKVLNGVLKPTKVINAICEILDIEYIVDEQKSD